MNSILILQYDTNIVVNVNVDYLFISRPTFEPVLETIDGLNVLCKRILEFCSTKEQFGALQQDIKVNRK